MVGKIISFVGTAAGGGGSLNGIVGDVLLDAGPSITITDDQSTKTITIDTIQDIRITATPMFRGLDLIDTATTGKGDETAINLSTYDPSLNGTANNPPGAQILITDDGAFGETFDILTKETGAIGNPLACRLRIDNMGRVGISEPSPAVQLQVNGSIVSTGIDSTQPLKRYVRMAYDENNDEADITSFDATTGVNLFKALNVRGKPILLNARNEGPVAIGTPSPTLTFEVVNQTGDSFQRNAGYGGSGMLFLASAQGTYTAPSPTLAGDLLGAVLYQDSDGANFVESVGVRGWAAENTAGRAHGGYLTLETTPNGTQGAKERMRIDQNGYVGLGSASPICPLDFGIFAANAPLVIGTYTYSASHIWSGIGMAPSSYALRLAGAGGANDIVDFGYYSTDGNYTWNSLADLDGYGNFTTAGTITAAGIHAPGSIPTTADYGCVGDGVTDDTANFQTAVNSTPILRVAKNAKIKLTTPVAFPSNFTLIMDPTAQLVNGAGANLPVGGGLVDLKGVTNVTIQGGTIEGNVVTPKGIDYHAPAGYGSDPSEDPWTQGTSIWLHPGSSNITIQDVHFNHTGGYAIYGYGDLNNIRIIRPRVTISRPCTMGVVGGDHSYGGWNGGIFFGSNGTVSCNNIEVLDAFFQNCTGTCFWTRSSVIPPSRFNKNIKFTGTAEDCLLDITQPGGINVYEESFHAKRVGYICTSGATSGFTTPGVLVDWSPTAFRCPKWLNQHDTYTGGWTNVAPTAADTTGILLNAHRSFQVDCVNGGLCSGDGMSCSTIDGVVGTSAFASTDPFANTGLCGPDTGNGATIGTNYTTGIVIGNSNGQATGNVTISGCTILGFQYLSIGIYGCQNSLITGCRISQPYTTAANQQESPITLGPITVSGVVHQATGIKVTGCHVDWPASGGYAIAESSEYGAFSTSACNFVDSMTTYNCSHLFYKDSNTNSTTGSLQLLSVTPQSAGAGYNVSSVLQTVGAASSFSDHVFQIYRGDGVELFSSSANGAWIKSALSLQNDGKAVYGPVLQLINAGPSGIANIDAYTYGNPLISGGGQTVPTLRYLMQDAGNYTGDHSFWCAVGGSPNGALVERFRIYGDGSGVNANGGYKVNGSVIINNVGAFVGPSITVTGNISGGSYYIGSSQFATAGSPGYVNLGNISQLLAVGNITTSAAMSATGGFLVGSNGVISSTRDFYGDSLSIGSTPAIAASAAGLTIASDRTGYLSQLYIGTYGSTPVQVLNTAGTFIGPAVTVPGNVTSTGGGFLVGATGVITNSRDFYGNSLSIGSTPAIAASAAGLAIGNDRTGYLSQLYIGTYGSSPTQVFNTAGAFVGSSLIPTGGVATLSGKLGVTGGVNLPTGIPAATSMTLYNNGGTLMWNGAPVTGGATVAGTTNYVPVFTAANTIGNSVIYQSGTNIGINTTSPGCPLDTGTALAPIKIASWQSGSAGYGIGVAGSQLTFGASINVSTGTPQMVLTSNGYLGIATTAPVGGLDLVGNGAGGWFYCRGNVGSTPSTTFNSGLAMGWNMSNGLGESVILYGTALGSVPSLRFGRWNGSAANIDMYLFNACLGIGILPASTLDVNGIVRIEQKNFGGAAGLMIAGGGPSANWPNMGFSTQNTNGSDVIFAGIYGQITSNTAGSEGGDMYFATAYNGTNSERMRIKNTGYIGVGTSDPSLGKGGSLVSQFTVVSGATAIAVGFTPSQPCMALNAQSNGAFTMYDYANGAFSPGITMAYGRIGIGSAAIPGYSIDVATGYSRLGGMAIVSADAGYEWWMGDYQGGATWSLVHRRISDGAAFYALTADTNGISSPQITIGSGSSSIGGNLGVGGNLSVTGTTSCGQISSTGASSGLYFTDRATAGLTWCLYGSSNCYIWNGSYGNVITFGPQGGITASAITITGASSFQSTLGVGSTLSVSGVIYANSQIQAKPLNNSWGGPSAGIPNIAIMASGGWGGGIGMIDGPYNIVLHSSNGSLNFGFATNNGALTDTMGIGPGGVLNVTNSYQVAGIPVINSSAQFIGYGVNVQRNGITCGGINPIDPTGTQRTGMNIGLGGSGTALCAQVWTGTQWNQVIWGTIPGQDQSHAGVYVVGGVIVGFYN